MLDKRKIFGILVFCFFVINCFSFEIGEKFWYFAGKQYVIVEGDQVCLNLHDSFQIKNFSDMELKNNGWYTCKFNGHNIDCIYGSNYFVIYSDEFVNGQNIDSFPRVNDFYDYVSKNYPSETHYGNDYFFSIRLKRIESIVVPDVLVETIGGKTVKYDTYDMQRYYAIENEIGLAEFNGNARPWATSMDPIGLEVQMNMAEPVDKIVILNGYVNPFKQHLYKANRRIKTAVVTSDEADFSLVVNFEDSVHFEQINLPVEVKTVNIKITDYYEGDKYTDLCVQCFGLPYEGGNLSNTSSSIINYCRRHPRQYKEYFD